MDIMQPISVTTSTLSITKRNHAGAALVANRAAGIAFTLPASDGSGAEYEIIVGTTVTSNTTTVKVANATDIMSGLAINAADGGATAVAFETGASDDTITMDGSTTGGIKGDRIRLKDIASGIWHVQVIGSATGTEATPFSATVS